MEFGSIQRELYVGAPPETVFDVVSEPGHVTQRWDGEVAFHVRGGGGRTEPFAVVDAQPPRRFSFRWARPAGQAPAESTSPLGGFDPSPPGSRTPRLTETGFRERGWEEAALEEQYRDHVRGWDMFLPRLAPYAEKLEARP
jgi:uncharacterized protein YndB with AHSA1/START domain